MNLTSRHIKTLITEKAIELGFVKVGFAKYEVLENESEKLRRWLDDKMQADMEWIERGFDKRKDIRLIMPDAKSVISLAFNYFTPFEHEQSKPKISRYSWGKDYHKVLKKKLKELCIAIEHLNLSVGDAEGVEKQTTPNPLLIKEGTKNSLPPSGGIRGIAYVDDGPVMDKAWAVKSGIGWMGKHTNIINPEYGSWIFLCEIITNIEFEDYDTQIEDLCGSCSLCISACPTGAITDEYIVDANICISYQTIENHGEIPSEINLDGWIFGCDVCQDVCPYNSPKYNHLTVDKSFYPSSILSGSEGSSASASDLLSITEEEFKVNFADSPIKRTKFKGWKRNLTRFRI